jgi:hypothetical protein
MYRPAEAVSDFIAYAFVGGAWEEVEENVSAFLHSSIKSSALFGLITKTTSLKIAAVSHG